MSLKERVRFESSENDATLSIYTYTGRHVPGKRSIEIVLVVYNRDFFS